MKRVVVNSKDRMTYKRPIEGSDFTFELLLSRNTQKKGTNQKSWTLLRNLNHPRVIYKKIIHLLQQGRRSTNSQKTKSRFSVSVVFRTFQKQTVRYLTSNPTFYSL